MPTNYIVTGYHGVDEYGEPLQHIDSNTDRDRNYAFYCSGLSVGADAILPVGNRMECVRSTPNTVTLKSGDLISCGTLARIPHGEEVTLTIQNGSASTNRNDIVYGLYERDPSTNIENYSFGVSRGDSVSGEPVDPVLRADDIITGGTVRYFPLYRIPIRGTAIGDPERIAYVGGSLELVSLDIGDPDASGDHYFRVRVKNKNGREIDLASAASGNMGVYNNASGHFIIYADNDNAVNVGSSSDTVKINGTLNAQKPVSVNSTLNVSGAATVGGKLSANGGVDVTGAVNAGSANTSGSIVAGSAERTSATSVRAVNQNSSVGIIASTNSAGEGGVYDFNHDKFLIAVDADGKVRIPSHSTSNLTADNISAVSDATEGSNSINVGNAVEVIGLVANATSGRAGVYSSTHGKYLIRINSDGTVELPGAVQRITASESINLTGNGSDASYYYAGALDRRYNAGYIARSEQGGGITFLSSANQSRAGIYSDSAEKWVIYVGRDGVVHIPAHESGAISATGTISTTAGVSASGSVSCNGVNSTGSVTVNGSGDRSVTVGASDSRNSATIRAVSAGGGSLSLISSESSNKAGLFNTARNKYLIDVPAAASGMATANFDAYTSDGAILLVKDGGNPSANGNNKIAFDSYADGGNTVHRLRPTSNGNVNLGSASYKWNTLYAATGTINTSDRNEKENIKELDGEKMVDFVMGLNPVSYRYKDGTSGRTHFGMVAQDVEQNMTENGMSDTDFAGFCRDDVNGESIYGLRYDEFIAPLIKVVQEQQKQIAELENRLSAMEGNA